MASAATERKRDPHRAQTLGSFRGRIATEIFDDFASTHQRFRRSRECSNGRSGDCCLSSLRDSLAAANFETAQLSSAPIGPVEVPVRRF